MQLQLGGRRALVTGGSKGVGLACAHGLAAEGVNLAIAARTVEPLKEATRLLRDTYDIEVTSHSCDLSRSDHQQALAEVVGPVDILVNNAGTIRRTPAVDHSDEDWDHVIEVNLTAPFILSRELGRSMLARGHGSIIFVASVLSFQGGITIPGYASSKSGAIGLTKALANEWAGHGVTVNAVAPGYMATDNTQALQDDPARSEAIVARIPAGDWGHPQSVAGTVVYLASSAADYVHGTVVTVDGGWMGR